MFKKILFGAVALGMIFSNSAAYALPQGGNLTPRQALYNYAKTGNVSALQAMKKQGFSIDLADEKGNSALCEATWRKDKNAVASLISAGANTNAACMQKIPASYKQAVGFKNVGQVASQSSMPAQKVGASSAAGVGETGLSTGAMVGIGVGAAAVIGGGIALAVSGGGGGSSKSVACSGHGEPDEDGECFCDNGYTGLQCDLCDIGYGFYGTSECHKTLTCGTDEHQEGDRCVSNAKSCSVNQYLQNGVCLPCQNGGVSAGGSVTTCTCQQNWTGTDCGTCKLKGAGVTADCSCETGYVVSGSSCVKEGEKNRDGYLLINGEWVADPTACPADYYGMAPVCMACPDNSHSVAGTRTPEGCICEEGQFCMYGIHGTSCPEGKTPVAGRCYSRGSCPEGYVDFKDDDAEQGVCVKAGKCTSDEINFLGMCLGQEDCPEGQVKNFGVCVDRSIFTDREEDKNPPIPSDPICGAHGAYSKLTEKCICTDGYSGDKCNIAPASNACDAVSCGEYGICNVKTGACVCKGGYSGTHCEIAPTGLNAETLSLNDEDLSFLLSASTVKNSTITPAKEGDLIGKTDVQNGGNIDLNNIENRNVYGLYYNDNFGYEPGPQTNGSEGAKSVISINNKSDGNVYGMWANMVEYVDNASSDDGKIYITNVGNGDVYGMWGTGDENFFNMCVSYDYVEDTGLLSIKNKGNGDVYGIHSFGGSDDAYIDVAWDARGMLDIYNEGDGNVYGLYGDRSIYTVYADSVTEYLNSQAIIQITNTGKGNSFALYGNNAHLVSNETLIGKDTQIPYTNNAIYMTNKGSGTAVGMYNSGKAIYNSGIITINNEGTGNAVGIFAAGVDTTVLNSGTITVNNSASANFAIGIYSKGGVVVNTGSIVINGDVSKAYGIYAEDGTTVYNTGTIQIGDYQYKGSSALENFIYLKGATLINLGTVSATSIDFDQLGGDVKISSNSKFMATDKIAGTLKVASDVVMNGFENLYIERDSLQAADTSKVKLQSDSAMFDASLAENGRDVVMQKKNFTDLTGNKSLAGFLEANYAAGNNENFFNQLKAIDSVAAFGSSLTDLTGQNTIARFAVEDLSAMREINFTMNKAMFQNAEKDRFETVGSLNGFAFKNNNASGGSYALASKKIAQNWKIGYAMSNTNLSTDDSEGTTRRNQMFNVFMPMGYERFGVRLISTPQIGFARGHYTRSGFEGSAYKGVIEKRTFALMNEARYPIRFGKMTIEPAVEFNAIAYNQRGHEDKKAYALTMPSDTNVSIESGVGLYALKDTQIGYEGRLSISAGLMMYREFADPYNIKMGMDGMSGSFNLYNERSPYRAVASFGLSYDIGGANMYGSVQHFMETDTHTTAKAGIKVGF